MIQKDYATLIERAKYLDAAYLHPVIAGYDGCVPRPKQHFDKRYMAAAIGGVADQQMLMQRLRFERRSLMIVT